MAPTALRFLLLFLLANKIAAADEETKVKAEIFYFRREIMTPFYSI